MPFDRFHHCHLVKETFFSSKIWNWYFQLFLSWKTQNFFTSFIFFNFFLLFCGILSLLFNFIFKNNFRICFLLVMKEKLHRKLNCTEQLRINNCSKGTLSCFLVLSISKINLSLNTAVWCIGGMNLICIDKKVWHHQLDKSTHSLHLTLKTFHQSHTDWHSLLNKVHRKDFLRFTQEWRFRCL